MKCPKCGYPRLKYKVQRNVKTHKKENKNARARRRKDNSGKHIEKPKPRDNWGLEPCPKCEVKNEDR
tara:strand:- start:1369 stop:1569 length:201 start_codon:yes stop_codon:yes gene_type:complete